MNYTLTSMTDDRNTCIVERREAVTKVESDRIKLFALKKKIDMEVMKLCLVSTDAMQQDYFQNLRKEIYKASKSRSSSTPLSPSTPFGGAAV